MYTNNLIKDFIPHCLMQLLFTVIIQAPNLARFVLDDEQKLNDDSLMPNSVNSD